METRTHTSVFNWREWLPSRGNVVFTLVVVFALFWAQSANALPWKAPAASATSTGTWPYQGRLADAVGNPITNTVPMIFRLYDSPTTGAVPLWEEQWTGPSSVLVSDGLFNVMLGSLTAIPQSVIDNNGSLWLGITAGTDDEMQPRIQIGSVPFAFRAMTVPDGSITTTKLADGSVTQAKLGADINLTPVDGSITTAKLADNAVSSAKIIDGSVTRTDLAPGTTSKITILSQPVEILNEWGGATSGRTLDLSSRVPTSADSVLLEVCGGGAWVRVRVYTPGATIPSITSQTPGDSACNQGWVKMSNRTIYYDTSMSPASNIIRIVGYME